MPKLLDILLQRNDATVPWGFQVRGGLDFGTHPVISAVTFGTLASQYLNAGDKILEIDKRKADSLLQSEVNRLLEDGYQSLHLLVEKLPQSVNGVRNSVRPSFKPVKTENSYDVLSTQECIKEKTSHPDGSKHSTRIWWKEKNVNSSLGAYDIEVNIERTKYKDKNESEEDFKERHLNSRNEKKLKIMSENFDKIFREKIGEWLEQNMLSVNDFEGRQQTNVSQGGDSVQSSQLPGPPPPPPPSFSGTIPGRRLKTEIPERSIEPPAAIQNAMMTKDKKPFTYTPGGIDLSEIRSPRMARRINRNACAEEIPGVPAPNISNNQQLPVDHSGNTNFSAMQSQLPAQVLPPGGIAPPPPPPPIPQSNSVSNVPPSPPFSTAAPAVNNTQSKPSGGRPPLGFDPNELFARVNKTPAYEPVKNNREEPVKNMQSQPIEEKNTLQSNYQKPQSPKVNEIGQNIYVPLQSEPGHIFVPEVTPKVQKEPSKYTPPVSNQKSRAQLGSIYIPPVSSTHQEQSTPSPSTQYGAKNQIGSSMTSSPVVETKQQAPWVTVYRTPQSSIPWTNREPESPKANNTRIIPIQVEGRDSPKQTIQSPQSHVSPPPFLQNQQLRLQNQVNQQQLQTQQKMQQPQPQLIQQQQQYQQYQQPQQSQTPHTRVIPIQIEGGTTTQQPRSPVGGTNQNKFNPMIPQSPTPYSPAQEKEQKPQWAPVQPKTPKKETDRPLYQNDSAKTPQQQFQPEYGNYNTAGVPVSELRKMQLSEDDRALMDKFKSQVERQGNDILNDENINPRYRGGYIPSKVFKMLDESVDEENYLHNESDPRYRGAAIPSRAFRMLQSMTDTAEDMPHQVPKSLPRAPTSRPLSKAQFQQDTTLGPNVPPSEQQVHEPRKYTGGSIPSRSFKMLQAMTGQEVSAPNTSGSTRGRETPMSGINQWYPSPCPSPIDLFWGYYPPDPYFMCNFIPDWNAAYGPPYHPIYPQIPAFLPYQVYQNSTSDNDEQGYSSSDELAQYHANYWRNFMYSPFQIRPERCSSTPSSFSGSRESVTPVRKIKKNEKIIKEYKEKIDSKKGMDSKKEIVTEDKGEKSFKTEDKEDEEDNEVDDEESETESEDGDKTPRSSLSKISGLQILKSVPNLNVYTSESLTSLVQKEGKVETNERESEEEISSSESLEDLDAESPVPHQLSIIFEESEHSDIESIKRIEETSTIYESESCSTINNNNDDVDDDESDNEILDSESSVIVRLPLKLKFDRTKNDEEVTTVIVGDSEIRKDNTYSLSAVKREENNFSDSEDGDVSVTFTIPTRSNSVISIERKSLEIRDKGESENEEILENKISGESTLDTVVTISLPSPKKSKNFMELQKEKIEEENLAFEEKTESCGEDFRSSVDKNNEETAINKKDKTRENERKIENFKLWIQNENEKDCAKIEETEKMNLNDSYMAEVGKLEKRISNFLETSKHSNSNCTDLFQENSQENIKPAKNSRLNKKESQEESEEDDSGVTSDVSNKQINSETDADTESDFSELSKMTQFQRASTHSRLFKLLQEECEKSENEIKEEDVVETKEEKEEEREILHVKKQKLTLPLHSNPHYFEVESLSSSSGIASPSSPIVSDKLVKELVQSLLNKKKGNRFKKIPLAKLHAAALRILQEEMDPYDTSPTSGEDAFFLSPTQTKNLHSSSTANFTNKNEVEVKETSLKSVYDDNYYDYLNYYNTWGNNEMIKADDCDVVPSKAFRMLREQTLSPKPLEGFKARCPRISSKKNIPELVTKKPTTIVTIQESQNEMECLTFAEKQEKVSEVLEKYKKN